MVRFNSDYSEGAHERILKRLMETNLEQTPGYGEDHYCIEAADMIRKLCQDESLAVHFLMGGTQTNLTVISAALRPHQGVLAAETAHIEMHETGAVEACGHKILTLPSDDGKITAKQVKALYEAHVSDENFEHTVQPKLVYISNPTELGAIYTKEELKRLYNMCQRCGLYLFLDGARLGYGLMASDNTLDLPTITECCDVFYIGGTKVGALFGEAVVIRNPVLKEDFRYVMKQKGGMLAKGRLLGIQFSELFCDGLYFEISKHANELADIIRKACEKKGFSFLVDNQTNQVFPILPDEVRKKLEKNYSFAHQCRIDASHSAVRFCTSWATKKEDVEKLAADIESA